jgi:phosphoribosylglycinamide formyltransferase
MYDGANAIARAYDDFQSGKLEDGQTGIMIHFVIHEVDRGEPILVEKIDCRAGESLQELENRMHAVEHGLIVRATAKVVADLEARRTQER